jgi:hypothetical protein
MAGFGSCVFDGMMPGTEAKPPSTPLVDESEGAISLGVREMACRLNRGSTSIRMTAKNLSRAAVLEVSHETLPATH